jgi:hypothetical protein
MRARIAVILAWAGVVAGGCGRGMPQGGPMTGPSAELALTGVSEPLTVDALFLVSPRWLPDGTGFLVSGRYGFGLYHVRMSGTRPGTVSEVDAGYRGPVAMGDGGGDFCIDAAGTAEAYVAANGKVRQEESAGSACASRLAATLSGEDLVLHDGGAGERVTYDTEDGLIKVSSGGFEQVVNVDYAWDVAVSPDGKKVAWCTGSLRDASLTVYDGTSGVSTPLRGVQPSWFPDGKYLVFASPAFQETLPGVMDVVDSDLYAFNVSTGAVIRLTESPAVCEMQPAVSPDGARVVYGDWKRGSVYGASVERRVP